VTFINYAATGAFFVYSFFLLIQTRELVRQNTIGSLSLTEVTFRLYSGYVITKKVLQLDDQFLIAGQTIFTIGIVLLWTVAIVIGIRDNRRLLIKWKTAIGLTITLIAGALLVIIPLNAALVAIGLFLVYGVVIQAIKVWQRDNILSIAYSEVTVRLIGCYLVTTKVIMTGDYWYSRFQGCFAIALTTYWLILTRTGLRSGEIKKRWQSATAKLQAIFAPTSS